MPGVRAADEQKLQRLDSYDSENQSPLVYNQFDNTTNQIVHGLDHYFKPVNQGLPVLQRTHHVSPGMNDEDQELNMAIAASLNPQPNEQLVSTDHMTEDEMLARALDESMKNHP